MIITSLAAESLGARSSAFFIETPDVKVLIDPGVSLAAVRFGLPPHPIEVKRMNGLWRNIRDHAARADVLIITHYHFDHFDPSEPLVFRDKAVLLKHPEENINPSQRQRAKDLLRSLGTFPRRTEIADGNRFEFGNTVIRFSPPVPHGPSTRVGWVVQASVREGDTCFLYTSDIQGACRDEHLEFILAEDPDIISMDGPLTYMLGQGFTPDDLKASVKNISRLIESTKVTTLILDHHGLRNDRWRDELREAFVLAGQRGKRIVSAAEFLGEKEELLEANRKRLFAEYPDMPEEPLMRTADFQLSKELGKSRQEKLF